MSLRRLPPEFDSTDEILDRILNKGLVVDSWLQIGLVGLELAGLESRFVAIPMETRQTRPGARTWKHR